MGGEDVNKTKVSNNNDEVLKFLKELEINPKDVGLKNIVIDKEDTKKVIKVLECSSETNKDFSAFNAKVAVFGEIRSIEDHYQLCKRFANDRPVNWEESKGKELTHIEINGHELDVSFLTPYYKLLWCKYLDVRKDLVIIVSEYDEFSDILRGNEQNC